MCFGRCAVFFFSSRRRHTRCSRDWSSDVCSSDLVVLNNARVIPARLFGRRAGVRSEKPSRSTRAEHLTGKVEVLLTRQVGDDAWEALVRPGRKMRLRERVLFGGGELEAEITARGDFGLRTLRVVSHDSRTVNEIGRAHV